MALSNLGRLNWYDRIQMAGTYAGDDSGADKHVGIYAASLQGAANQAVACPHEDDFDAAQFVT
jgi:hypothetical protein